MSQKSILFIWPDYHCSFFYRDELRRLGWKADVFVGDGYPDKLLYSSQDILRAPTLHLAPGIARSVNVLLRIFFYLFVALRYRYHVYYGGFESFSFKGKRLGLDRILGASFQMHLWIAKLLGRKIVHLPSGCLEEETKANFGKLDHGNVCGNCGSEKFCSDRKNIARFDQIRRYADMMVGTGSIDSSQFNATHFRWKSIDLDLWRPDLEIPPAMRLPATENLRILHSFYKLNREHGGKNIKGSPFIIEAIERLQREGHKVEYIHPTDVPSKEMRFYQAQADIVVEQLIYGWWGSTGVETMALGKPVVCYIRPSWKQFFLKTFPEYTELPIVEADTQTIYDVLKKLVTDADYRRRKGEESRRFAEQHFDPKKNAPALAELLMRL